MVDEEDRSSRSLLREQACSSPASVVLPSSRLCRRSFDVLLVPKPSTSPMTSAHGCGQDGGYNKALDLTGDEDKISNEAFVFVCMQNSLPCIKHDKRLPL